ncbi:MAG: sugar transferase [Achromobacter sp.]
MGKRFFDLAVSVTGLLALLPFLLLISLAIKLDSPGPVFFRQERIGRGGVPFRIHKLRSMHIDTGASSRRRQITVENDERITRVGRLIRKWKLDELVQLLDVVRGAMSLVGPRPEVAHYVALYPDATRDAILSVRPGITDPASIRFRNESVLLAQSDNPERTYREVILPEKLSLQMDYVANRSFTGDLKIIAATVLAILK